MSWQTETPHEQIDRLRAELKRLQKELAKKETELSELYGSLQAFEAEYDERVGHLLEEYALLEAEVEAYMSRIRQIRDEQTFGEGYQGVQDQYDAKWNAPHQEKPQVKNLQPKPVTAARLKKVYRQLARKYHPDLAKDEADRERRTAMMTAVNDAYKAGSLTELEALALDEPQVEVQTVIRPDKPRVTPRPQTETEMIRVLEEEIEHTRRLIFGMRDDLQNFHHRPLVELALDVRFAKRDGRDVLAELSTELERKIARKQVELDMIKSQFSQL
ncbi:MAG: DnaJ domain-containing protein [Chloroflexi bacterium]|nr:DnaJ domain-containing protein [Chloroflexota bacterium]